MRKDGIFRMASMTKPVAGVAVLMLLEEGKVRLTDPVSRFIPEFKDAKVAVANIAAPGDKRRPLPSRRCRASRPRRPRFTPCRPAVTSRCAILLTHTSGLESGGAGTREGARIALRAARTTISRATSRSSARSRSTSSPVANGATAASPALTRSAGSSRSRPA